MRRQAVILFTAELFQQFSHFPVAFFPGQGEWKSDSGAIYHIRQGGVRGISISWKGKMEAKKPDWGNVFDGKIRGTEIHGNWGDIFKGKVRNSGDLSLRIAQSENSLTVIRQTGGFGNRSWSRLKPGSGEPVDSDPLEDQEAVFDCYYIDFSRGFQKYGVYIGRSGNIYTYNVTKSSSYGAMRNKHPNKELVGQVNAQTLLQKIELVRNAKAGPVLLKQRGIDIGRSGCYGYIYNEDNTLWDAVQLGGIFFFPSVENSSKSAKELIKWLEKVYKDAVPMDNDQK